MLVQMLWRNYLYIRTHRSESSLVLGEPYGRQDYGVLVVHKKKHGRGKELLAKFGYGVLTRRANECGGVFEVDDEMLLNLSC